MSHRRMMTLPLLLLLRRCFFVCWCVCGTALAALLDAVPTSRDNPDTCTCPQYQVSTLRNLDNLDAVGESCVPLTSASFTSVQYQPDWTNPYLVWRVCEFVNRVANVSACLPENESVNDCAVADAVPTCTAWRSRRVPERTPTKVFFDNFLFPNGNNESDARGSGFVNLAADYCAVGLNVSDDNLAPPVCWEGRAVSAPPLYADRGTLCLNAFFHFPCPTQNCQSCLSYCIPVDDVTGLPLTNALTLASTVLGTPPPAPYVEFYAVNQDPDSVAVSNNKPPATPNSGNGNNAVVPSIYEIRPNQCQCPAFVTAAVPPNTLNLDALLDSVPSRCPAVTLETTEALPQANPEFVDPYVVWRVCEHVLEVPDLAACLNDDQPTFVECAVRSPGPVCSKWRGRHVLDGVPTAVFFDTYRFALTPNEWRSSNLAPTHCPSAETQPRFDAFCPGRHASSVAPLFALQGTVCLAHRDYNNNGRCTKVCYSVQEYDAATVDFTDTTIVPPATTHKIRLSPVPAQAQFPYVELFLVNQNPLPGKILQARKTTNGSGNGGGADGQTVIGGGGNGGGGAVTNGDTASQGGGAGLTGMTSGVGAVAGARRRVPWWWWSSSLLCAMIVVISHS